MKLTVTTHWVTDDESDFTYELVRNDVPGVPASDASLALLEHIAQKWDGDVDLGGSDEGEELDVPTFYDTRDEAAAAAHQLMEIAVHNFLAPQRGVCGSH